MELSVVIPAYNEAERLGPTLERIVGYLKEREIEYEVLVVAQDGTDRTTTHISNFKRQCHQFILSIRNTA
jgi:dolichyl-phosphate beta-glucosyltransferase